MSDSAAAAAIQRRVRSRQLPAEDASPPASAAKKVSSGRKLGEPVPVKFKAPPSTSPKAGSRKLGEPVKVKSPSKLSSKSASEAPPMLEATASDGVPSTASEHSATSYSTSSAARQLDGALRDGQDARRRMEAAHRQAALAMAKKRDDAIAQAQDWSRRAAALELEMAEEERVLAGLIESRSHDEQQQVRARAVCRDVEARCERDATLSRLRMRPTFSSSRSACMRRALMPCSRSYSIISSMRL